MALNPGELRELVVFQKRVTETDRGDVKDSYENAFATRAAVRVASTRDADRMAYIGESVLYVVKIRFRTGIDPLMRIVWQLPEGERYLHIEGIPYDPDMKHETLLIGATEEL